MVYIVTWYEIELSNGGEYHREKYAKFYNKMVLDCFIEKAMDSRYQQKYGITVYESKDITKEYFKIEG